MAPAYKLTYFDIRGAAEGVRFILKYGGIDFEDNRIQKEDWPKIKDTTPFGQLPVLEHNGKKVNQSIAISRYLGKLAKIAGNNEWEDLEIDAIVDTFSDLRAKLSPILREQDEAKKKELKEALLKDTVPYYLSRLDAIVKKNNGYLAVGRLTWADLRFAAMGPTYDKFLGAEVVAQYPNLQALRQKVEALPAIKKWIETRPKTDF